jgi:DNA-binding NarL/FixJ family response regulator
MSKKILIIKGDPTQENEFRTKREIDNLAAKGKTAAAIAQELNLDVSYVGSIITGG